MDDHADYQNIFDLLHLLIEKVENGQEDVSTVVGSQLWNITVVDDMKVRIDPWTLGPLYTIDILFIVLYFKMYDIQWR